jgi:type II secretion system protein N
VKDRLLRVARWLAFPAFYLFCLGIFGYLKFPYDRLKDRIVLEIEKRGKPGQRIEVGHLGSYWFTGVELSNVKLHLPPDDAPAPGLPDLGGGAGKESVVTIDEAHARVRILPLLIGRVRVDFWASAFGGEIKGTVPVGDAKGDVELEVADVDIGKIDPIVQTLGVPMKGTASGKLQLSSAEGKFNKANGTLDFTIAGVTVSDGKTKIQGLLELPQAKLGDIKIQGEAKDGVLKIEKLSANGTDLELLGDGKVTLKEPFSEAVFDLFVRFKFTDAYRGKSSMTKTLLGEPGSSVPGLIEMQVPKMKRAKRPDGFFGWHIHGAMKKLKFDPSTADSPSGGAATPAKRGGKGADSPFNAVKRPGGAGMPLGPSTAKTADEPNPAAAERKDPPEIVRPSAAQGAEAARRAAAPEVVAPTLNPAGGMPIAPALQPVAPPPAPQPEAPPQPAPTEVQPAPEAQQPPPEQAPPQ